MGLQLGADETRTSRSNKQKPEKIPQELIKGVRPSTNAENACAIKATDSWPIFTENTNWTGKRDAQEQVEFQAELMSARTEEERAGRATQLAEAFASNQIESHMFAVHAK